MRVVMIPDIKHGGVLLYRFDEMDQGRATPHRSPMISLVLVVVEAVVVVGCM